MGVYIKGIEMPKKGNWKTVRIYPDGSCAVPNWQGDCTFIKDAKAISIPSHSRLIDANMAKVEVRRAEALARAFGYHNAVDAINNAPTIIESENG